MLNLAFEFTVLLIIDIAALSTNFGKLEYYLHKSSANCFRLEKGLSNTRPAIEGSLSACIKAVTAPILLPNQIIKS